MSKPQPPARAQRELWSSHDGLWTVPCLPGSMDSSAASCCRTQPTCPQPPWTSVPLAHSHLDKCPENGGDNAKVSEPGTCPHCPQPWQLWILGQEKQGNRPACSRTVSASTRSRSMPSTRELTTGNSSCRRPAGIVDVEQPGPEPPRRPLPISPGRPLHRTGAP